MNESSLPIRKVSSHFLEKINSVQRFIPDYSSIIKPMTKLLRKDHDFQWTPKFQKEFSNIKVVIASSPVLVCPNFDNHFILYSFASKDTRRI